MKKVFILTLTIFISACMVKNDNVILVPKENNRLASAQSVTAKYKLLIKTKTKKDLVILKMFKDGKNHTLKLLSQFGHNLLTIKQIGEKISFIDNEKTQVYSVSQGFFLRDIEHEMFFFDLIAWLQGNTNNTKPIQQFQIIDGCKQFKQSEFSVKMQNYAQHKNFVLPNLITIGSGQTMLTIKLLEFSTQSVR